MKFNNIIRDTLGRFIPKKQRDSASPLSSEYGAEGGRLRNWGEKEEYVNFQEGLAKLIIEKDLLPNLDPDRKVRIVSVSANSGLSESELQNEYGDRCSVVVADFVVPKIRYEESGRIRHDARELPFKSESIGLLMDIMGALWYASISEESEELIDLMNGYVRVLEEGGILAIDTSTDVMINTALKFKESDLMRREFEVGIKYPVTDTMGTIFYKKRKSIE